MEGLDCQVLTYMAWTRSCESPPTHASGGCARPAAMSPRTCHPANRRPILPTDARVEGGGTRPGRALANLPQRSLGIGRFTYKTVEARFWPWFSDTGPSILIPSKLFTVSQALVARTPASVFSRNALGHTLHPAPCTLHPASCTLHPAPFNFDPTLHPAP